MAACPTWAAWAAWTCKRFFSKAGSRTERAQAGPFLFRATEKSGTDHVSFQWKYRGRGADLIKRGPSRIYPGVLNWPQEEDDADPGRRGRRGPGRRRDADAAPVRLRGRLGQERRRSR